MSVFLSIVEDVRSNGGDVSATVSIPDPVSGDKVRLQTTTFPAGDVRDPQTWLHAASDGCNLSSKVACGTGTVQVKAKNLIGDAATNHVAKLFGIATAGKPHRKGKDRGGVDDAVLNGKAE